MKASSLRAAYVSATVAALLALPTVEPASAHVEIRPALLERGEVTEIRVELPGIDPGAPVARLEVDGEGVEVLSTRRVGAGGPESQWSVRVRTGREPGPVSLVLRPVYADGAEAEFEQTLTVVPAREAPFPWTWVAGGVAAGAALGAALAFLRRRSA